MVNPKQINPYIYKFMGRTHVSPIQQPDDTTCGPAASKLALQILGTRKSLRFMTGLCRTNRNGTSTINMVKAMNKLGFPVMVVQYATLHHLQSALRYPPNQVRAVMVSYLYEDDDKERPHPDSGHWAVVSSFSASESKIVLLDSAEGRKKSYDWQEFRNRWTDFDYKRKKLHARGHKYKLYRHWQPQMLMVVAKDPENLPKFKIQSSKTYLPN